MATRLGKALRSFVQKAYEVLTAAPNGVPLLPQQERELFVGEADGAMRALMTSGRVRVESDLIFCLEAFGASKGRPTVEQDWISRCLVRVLAAGLSVGEAAAVETCKEAMRSRIRGETGELYSCIDVRAWPNILGLLDGAARELLDPASFRQQVSYQLCMARGREWYAGLLQAAKLLSELRMADCFDAHELCEVFNNKIHFDRRQRQDLLFQVLQRAPRDLTMDVLRIIDGDDLDIEERDDQELDLVRALVRDLKEDIRCCKHLFFKMKSDWLVNWARHYMGSGVVYNQELTPDQICDHIEDEDNHEEFLKLAVKEYVKADRKSEAARMLARTKSRVTRCFDNNRNDKELSYYVSVYEDVQPLVDLFGPVEDDLALPGSGGDVLYVADAGPGLAQLEQETLGRGAPMALGVWWLWRCFDPRLDLWPRASIMVLAYEGRLAIVDFMQLESSTEATEVRGKDLVRRIMEAPHLLKVVHGLATPAIQALQRAAVPRSELAADEAPIMPRLSPVVDVALVMAYVRKSRQGDPLKLTGLTFAYLRMELCVAECLSNFERRPLRLSQQHYALTLAWCPLMILRAHCAYGVVSHSQVAQFLLQTGIPGPPCEDMLQRVSFEDQRRAPQAPAEAEPETPSDMNAVSGGYAENLWSRAEWVEALPRPDPQARVGAFLQPHVGRLLLPAEAAAQAQPSLESLFDRDVARRELEALYQAYHAHQQAKAQLADS